MVLTVNLKGADELKEKLKRLTEIMPKKLIIVSTPTHSGFFPYQRALISASEKEKHTSILKCRGEGLTHDWLQKQNEIYSRNIGKPNLLEFTRLAGCINEKHILKKKKGYEKPTSLSRLQQRNKALGL